MPTYQFEAMDARGEEIRDVIEAESEEAAQNTIRGMGYFVTKITAKKGAKKDGASAPAAAGGKKSKGFSLSLGGVKSKHLCLFTRQLSILQDAGLPILRSLKILSNQAQKGRLKDALESVCTEIEGGSTFSEALGKEPRVFSRLYVNMIKAGEAGGALEVILRRLSEFMERSESLKRQVKGALMYPIMVVLVAVGILTFIMLKIVPSFKKIFADFGTTLPPVTEILISISNFVASKWFLIPLVPISIVFAIKGIRKFKEGRMGWDSFIIKVPIFGNLMEKSILARTTRTLGTLITSGVPILEALNITRETSGNALFEKMFGRVSDSIREGEAIAKPMKEFSRPGFHPVALFFWMAMFAGPLVPLLFFKNMGMVGLVAIGMAAAVGAMIYRFKMEKRIMDDLVVNMVDVGEETGELDTMLYKVADTFDEEVKVMTESLAKLMEPLLIVFLGGAVGFIVVALFMPLISLITKLAK